MPYVSWNLRHPIVTCLTYPGACELGCQLSSLETKTEWPRSSSTPNQSHIPKPLLLYYDRLTPIYAIVFCCKPQLTRLLLLSSTDSTEVSLLCKDGDQVPHPDFGGHDAGDGLL
jgi:hypothetical protein